MKRAIIFIYVLFLTTFSSEAQVADIGVKFNKKGFIQDVNTKQGYITAHFIDKNNLSVERLTTRNLNSVTIDSKTAQLQMLYPGMEITVAGDFFETTKTIEAHKIIASTPEGKTINIKKGRIDLIKDGFCYTDGHKVKLAPKTQITGEKKSGYDGKTFKSFSEIKLGDFIHVTGKYTTEGYISATKVTIEPETISENDRLLVLGMDSLQQVWYSYWKNPSTRPNLFGTYIDDYAGYIVADQELQQYVSDLGHSLIPSHLKNKHKWMFIVTDSPYFNAGMLPTGICFVHLGLLTSLENESQLATILGHEITHAIYEHRAEEMIARKKVEAKTEKRNNSSGKLRALIEQYQPNLSVKDKRGNIVFQKKIGVKTFDLLLKELPNAQSVASFWEYNQGQELQSDRIGLTLMAQAGYDVREAPKVWINSFLEDAAVAEKKKAKGESQEVKKKEKPQQHYKDLADMASGFINNSLQKKTNELHKQEGISHPKDIERIENLQRFIGQYYHNPVNASESKNRLEKVLQEFYKRVLENRKKEEQRLAALEKKIQASVPKQNQRLNTVTKPLLTYKGYALRPMVDVKAFIKHNCQAPYITNAISLIDEQYRILADPNLETKINEFKKTKDAEVKDEFFSFHYVVFNALNERIAYMAAAVETCDAYMVDYYMPTVSDLGEIIDDVDSRRKFYEQLRKKK